MLCQICQKNPASVHVTEIVEISGGPPDGKQGGEEKEGEKLAGEKPAGEQASEPKLEKKEGSARSARKEIHEQHLCEACAGSVDLPHAPAMKKSQADIWKLLQISSQQTRKRGGPSCPDCGMSLDEFRKKGRLGCARDYEVFKNHIGDLLERVHGARAHVGRVPGTNEADSLRSQRLTLLKQQLEDAIRTEAYESAARLRDEIKALDQSGTS